MRNVRKWIGGAALTAAALVVGGGLAAAQESPEVPSTKPAMGTPAMGAPATKPARKRPVRLVKPYSDLQDLTPTQAEGIKAIHAEILDRKAELDRVEREKIMALLSDEQRAKVEELESDKSQQTKDRSAAARGKKATTQEAGDDGQ